VLDLDSFTWRRPAVSGATPSPREGAAAAYHAGHMVLFGEDRADSARLAYCIERQGITSIYWDGSMACGPVQQPGPQAQILLQPKTVAFLTNCIRSAPSCLCIYMHAWLLP
jgi:hypothetical protein